MSFRTFLQILGVGLFLAILYIEWFKRLVKRENKNNQLDAEEKERSGQ